MKKPPPTNRDPLTAAQRLIRAREMDWYAAWFQQHEENGFAAKLRVAAEQHRKAAAQEESS
jgi:hypothetical protein